MSRAGRARRMSQREAASAAAGAIVAANDPGRAIETFAFGDPEPVLNRRELLDMLECWHNGRWYEPPVPVDGLARAFRASPHHSSAILLKRNLVTSALIPTPWLSRSTFGKALQDYLVFGNGYLERRDSVLGTPLRLDYSPAKFTRRGVEAGSFFYVPGGRSETEFKRGSVIQTAQPDINQEIYGVPEYLSALQSALLNEAATLFRRRYYLNGSHAGYILYATGDIDQGDTDKLKAALRASKGPGNFRNLFVHAPNGKDGSLKILPIAEAGAKDEFLGIKNATRDDVLAAHRVPPSLLGIVPAQGSTTGNPLQAMQMFWELEIVPLMLPWLEINDRLGVPAVAFEEREFAPGAT
ncbi:phage portal protein [Sphingomonas jatrophae]|uniref:Phage portal protein, PBSX family n=1 Tax=Sphingomonas jatrophae TaxID=1166337 RepID=A0A1I6JLI7_9SPHN|nr:phage portal protein [Sphingomonas jatrophae]SFR79842.1 phage portal protein, PBSX family [Sphingomonas jatrophae]